MKKGRGIYIISPIGKKYAYLSPNWLKTYKIAKKKADNFPPAARTLIIRYIIWGKNINQEGGVAGNMNFKRHEEM